MEPCNNKYGSSWNDNLYIYTNRSLCYADNHGYCDDCTGNTNVHADRTTLSEQYSTCTSSNIRQWLCRNMEPCNNKYSNSWNNDLYIYTNRSLCYCSYNGYHDRNADNTNVYTNRTSLPE